MRLVRLVCLVCLVCLWRTPPPRRSQVNPALSSIRTRACARTRRNPKPDRKGADTSRRCRGTTAARRRIPDPDTRSRSRPMSNSPRLSRTRRNPSSHRTRARGTRPRCRSRRSGHCHTGRPGTRRHTTSSQAARRRTCRTRCSPDSSVRGTPARCLCRSILPCPRRTAPRCRYPDSNCSRSSRWLRWRMRRSR